MLPDTTLPDGMRAIVGSTVHEPAGTQPPLLYTYRRCPYAMRACMALLQAGVALDAHEIVLRDKPPEMLAASAKGTVPVLVVPGAGVVDESLEIMRWACQGRDPGGWWGRAQSDHCWRCAVRG